MKDELKKAIDRVRQGHPITAHPSVFKQYAEAIDVIITAASKPDAEMHPDMFWDVDNPESAESDPEYILSNAGVEAEVIVEFMTAKKLPNKFGVYLSEDEDSFRLFDTESEAKEALAQWRGGKI